MRYEQLRAFSEMPEKACRFPGRLTPLDGCFRRFRRVNAEDKIKKGTELYFCSVPFSYVGADAPAGCIPGGENRSVGRALPVSFAVQPSYSVRNATTGSFRAAILEGIRPAMKVRNILIATSRTAPISGREAFRIIRPVRW